VSDQYKSSSRNHYEQEAFSLYNKLREKPLGSLSRMHLRSDFRMFGLIAAHKNDAAHLKEFDETSRGRIEAEEKFLQVWEHERRALRASHETLSDPDVEKARQATDLSLLSWIGA